MSRTQTFVYLPGRIVALQGRISRVEALATARERLEIELAEVQRRLGLVDSAPVRCWRGKTELSLPKEGVS